VFSVAFAAPILTQEKKTLPRDDDWNLRERRLRRERAEAEAGSAEGPAAEASIDTVRQRWIESPLARRVLPVAVSAVVGLLIAAGCWYRLSEMVGSLLNSGASMGMRCSGPSLYMRERFDLPDRQGCVVLRVSGSAEAAGIEQGWLMVEMNGQPITSGPQYFHRFNDEIARSDDPVQFKFVLPGESEPLDVLVEWQPATQWDEDPSDPVYYFAHARADEGRHPDEQIANYSRAIELAPDFDLALLYRADAYWYSFADYNKAYSDYTSAASLNPKQGEAQRELGWMAYRSADRFLSPSDERSWFDEAESFAHRAIEAHECEGAFEGANYDCAMDYVLLAHVVYRKSELARAIDAAQRALAYYPADPDAHEIIAIAYAFFGDRDQAIEHAKAYLRFPDDETGEANRDFMRTLAKDPEEAKRDLWAGASR
jgi:tetratricopeptide (TPR) repeat protein